jgi:cytochrome c
MRALLLVVVLLPLLPVRAQVAPPDEARPRVLLFSRTTGFRHDAIPAAAGAIARLGVENGFAVDSTEEPAAFDDATLGRYAAVVFLLTTGDVLDADGQAAFERYLRAGHGYVGVHSASDTEYDWPWYGRLVGAYFAAHPAIQPALVRVEDATHPSTAGLPSTWSRTDEWYNFGASPRGAVQVLLTLDERSYVGGSMGADHPIAWYHEYDGGRAWYTAMGHTADSYSEPAFLTHLLGGIQYAAGLSPVGPTPRRRRSRPRPASPSRSRGGRCRRARPTAARRSRSAGCRPG